MMIIRKEQLEAMQDVMLPRFDSEAARYLRDHVPDRTASLDDDQLLNRVSAGKRHARSYGVVAPAALLQFLVLRFLLGDDFDVDQRYEEISAPLRDTFYPDADARVEEVVFRVRRFLGEDAPE
jgi:hypothetical protein